MNVGKAAVLGNVSQRQVSLSQELLGMLDTQAQEILMRRET